MRGFLIEILIAPGRWQALGETVWGGRRGCGIRG